MVAAQPDHKAVEAFLSKLISKNRDAVNVLPLVLAAAGKACSFEMEINDPKKSNVCLNTIRKLAGDHPGLATEILSEAIHFHDYWKMEKDLKDRPDKGTIKVRQAYISKMQKKILTISTELQPDPARFDLAYLFTLIMQKASEKKRVDEHLRDYVKQTRQIGKNPKGFASIRRFISRVHSIMGKHDSPLTDSAICVLIAGILTILTGKSQSRENVQKILSRQLNAPATPAK